MPGIVFMILPVMGDRILPSFIECRPDPMIYPRLLFACFTPRLGANQPSVTIFTTSYE
jgi:hypothetical protein